MPFFLKSVFQKSPTMLTRFSAIFSEKLWFFALGAKLQSVEVRQGKKKDYFVRAATPPFYF